MLKILSPSQIVSGFYNYFSLNNRRSIVLCMCFFIYLYNYYKKNKNHILFFIFKHTKKGKLKIEQKKKDAMLVIKNKLFPNSYTYNFDKLPVNGISKTNIMDIVYERKSKVSNKISGCVYGNNKDCENLLQNINQHYLYSNPLHPDIYPELIKMESEIIKMVGHLFELPESGGGNLTTGGTESTICALKAYKKHKKKYFNLFRPEVLCTKTVHAAVNKACDLLDLKIVYIDLDKNNVMDLDDLKRKISINTCVIVASYPCFAYGLCDPIEKIGKIAKENNVYLHVDACLGGFITQFDENLKLSFKNNISSISVDPHKFGYAPKGSSILLWKSRKMKHNQYFIQNDWTGGIYASVSLPGSRVGSQIATTWGCILYYGYEQYEIYSKKIIQKTKYLSDKINNIDNFHVIGEPNVNVVAFYSTKYPVGQILECVSEEGWNLNILQEPLCLHLCLTPKNMYKLDELIDCLKKLNNKEVKENFDNIASIYGLSAQIPDKSIINEIVNEYLDMTTNI